MDFTNILFQHHDDFDHDYDHEAFLGEEQAHEFDELTPEESQRRLGMIVDRWFCLSSTQVYEFIIRIDADADGIVSVDELGKWIKFTQTRLDQRLWLEQGCIFVINGFLFTPGLECTRN